MRITSWNVNGLRAAHRKGVLDWLDRLAPDVVMWQEIRCVPEQLEAGLARPDAWHAVWHPAARLGYAGVATWSRHPIEVLSRGMGDDDPDGRILTVRTGGVVISNVYLPSGSAGPERQASKDAWTARFLPWASALATRGEPVVMGGDLNIAHTERDIHNPKGNARNSGFLPYERAWFGSLLAGGWSDLVRARAGEVQGPYSWWSNRGQARALDRGWRIDYLLGNARAAEALAGASILREGGLAISDHAPVTVDLTAP